MFCYVVCGCRPGFVCVVCCRWYVCGVCLRFAIGVWVRMLFVMCLPVGVYVFVCGCLLFVCVFDCV